ENVCSRSAVRTLPGHRTRLLWQRSFGGKLNEAKAVHIGRDTPVAAAGVEFEAGVIGRRPADDRIAVPDIRADLPPNHLAHAAAVIPDIDAGANLQEPYRQSAPQPRRRVLNDDDHHRPTPRRPRMPPASPPAALRAPAGRRLQAPLRWSGSSASEFVN